MSGSVTQLVYERLHVEDPAPIGMDHSAKSIIRTLQYGKRLLAQSLQAKGGGGDMLSTKRLEVDCDVWYCRQ